MNAITEDEEWYEEQRKDRLFQMMADQQALDDAFAEAGLDPYEHESLESRINRQPYRPASFLYQEQRRNKEERRIKKITDALVFRENYLKAQEQEVARNREARMLREIEEYATEQDAIRQREQEQRELRKLAAERKRNEYKLRRQFINNMNK